MVRFVAVCLFVLSCSACAATMRIEDMASHDGQLVVVADRLTHLPDGSTQRTQTVNACDVSENARLVCYPLAVDFDVPLARLGISYKDAKGGGAEITKITPGGPADGAGIALGDVILAVNLGEIRDAVTLRQVLGSPRRRVLLRVRRGDQEFSAQIDRTEGAPQRRTGPQPLIDG